MALRICTCNCEVHMSTHVELAAPSPPSVPSPSTPPFRQKTACRAYLWWFPLGLLGAHRYYLQHWDHAFLLTIFGWVCSHIGLYGAALLTLMWLFEGTRLYGLVDTSNRCIAVLEAKGRCMKSGKEGASCFEWPPWTENLQRGVPLSLTDAYITWFPLGLFGFHHMFLRNTWWAAAYFF